MFLNKIAYLIFLNCLVVTISAAEPIPDLLIKDSNNLKFGKSNLDILKLNLFLNENYYYGCENGEPNSPGKETKKFDECTKKSVCFFQRYSDLVETCVVDQATLSEIKRQTKELGYYLVDDRSPDLNKDLQERTKINIENKSGINYTPYINTNNNYYFQQLLKTLFQ